MNLPQVEADVKAVCHMMRARPPSSSSSEASEARSEDTDDQGYPVDNGPTPVGASHWRLNLVPAMMPDEVLLDTGRTLQVTDPYFYKDALRDGIVQEVLFPGMIQHWFRNRERDIVNLQSIPHCNN